MRVFLALLAGVIVSVSLYYVVGVALKSSEGGVLQWLRSTAEGAQLLANILSIAIALVGLLVSLGALAYTIAQGSEQKVAIDSARTALEAIVKSSVAQTAASMEALGEQKAIVDSLQQQRAIATQTLSAQAEHLKIVQDRLAAERLQESLRPVFRVQVAMDALALTHGYFQLELGQTPTLQLPGKTPLRIIVAVQNIGERPTNRLVLEVRGDMEITPLSGTGYTDSRLFGFRLQRNEPLAVQETTTFEFGAQPMSGPGLALLELRLLESGTVYGPYRASLVFGRQD